MADSVSDIIRRKALQYGIDPDVMIKRAQLESGLGTAKGNGGGVYQFIPGTWGQYGQGQNVLDPEANIDAGMRHQLDITQQMTKALGRQPTQQELYLASMHGVGGATALINNPQQPAVESLAPLYQTKKDPTGFQGARAALAGNAQTNDMTSQDVVGNVANRWDAKYVGAGNASDPAMAQTPTPPDPRTANDADLAGYGSSPPQGKDTTQGQQDAADQSKMMASILGATKDFTKAGIDAYSKSIHAAPKPIAAPDAHIPQPQQGGGYPDFMAALQQRLQQQGVAGGSLSPGLMQLLAQKRLTGGS